MNRACPVRRCTGSQRTPYGLRAGGGCSDGRPAPAARLLSGAAIVAALLAGCAGTARPPTSSAEAVPQAPSTWPAADGPPANPPPNLAHTPDAEPRVEPLRSSGPNKPYEVLGQRYTPQLGDEPFEQSGLASWYGRKFHGRRTASGEVYDMYAMTAAHRTWPIPSYALVRNPRNGREVVVRINDRGPFKEGWIVDLSYAAAVKLGVERGVAAVQLRRLTHDEIRSGRWREATAAAAAGSGRAAAPAEATTASVPMPAAAPVAGAAAGPAALAPPQAPVLPASLSGPAAAVVPAALPGPAAAPAEPTTLPAQDSVVAARSNPQSPGAEDAPAGALSARPGPVAAPTDESGDRPTAVAADAPRGYWLQFGAFSRREGAIDLKLQLMRELDWLAHALTVFDERSLWRVQAGPYASHAEALGAARRVRAATAAVRPLILQRR